MVKVFTGRMLDDVLTDALNRFQIRHSSIPFTLTNISFEAFPQIWPETSCGLGEGSREWMWAYTILVTSSFDPWICLVYFAGQFAYMASRLTKDYQYARSKRVFPSVSESAAICGKVELQHG